MRELSLEKRILNYNTYRTTCRAQSTAVNRSITARSFSLFPPPPSPPSFPPSFPRKKVAVRWGKKTGTFDRTPRALSDKLLLMECLVNCTSGPREIRVTTPLRLRYFPITLLREGAEIRRDSQVFPFLSGRNEG